MGGVVSKGKTLQPLVGGGEDCKIDEIDEIDKIAMIDMIDMTQRIHKIGKLTCLSVRIEVQ